MGEIYRECTSGWTRYLKVLSPIDFHCIIYERYEKIFALRYLCLDVFL